MRRASDRQLRGIFSLKACSASEDLLHLQVQPQIRRHFGRSVPRRQLRGGTSSPSPVNRYRLSLVIDYNDGELDSHAAVTSNGELSTHSDMAPLSLKRPSSPSPSASSSNMEEPSAKRQRLTPPTSSVSSSAASPAPTPRDSVSTSMDASTSTDATDTSAAANIVSVTEDTSASKAMSASSEPAKLLHGEAKVVKTTFAIDEPQQLLMRSVALALDHVGFDAATPEAMEGLRAAVDACMSSYPHFFYQQSVALRLYCVGGCTDARCLTADGA